MSSGEVRKVSRQDIQLVQNLIERCLQLYMNQKEVMNTLLIQAKIEPSFTELVWQKLEEENQEFFKAYHVRLVVKNQIMIFNQLLEKQAQLMREVQPTGVGTVSLTNGSNTPLHQMPLGYPLAPRPDQAHCSIIPSNVINGGLSSHQGIQVANGSSMSAERINMSTGMLPVQNQNEQMELLQGINGTAIKPEPGFSNNNDFPFCSHGNFLEERTTIVDPPGSTFGCTELIDPTITEPLMGTADPNSYGFLSQIPRNFSFSDLTDHDILETYSRSPFLDPETNGFSASPIEEHESENKRLDTISEGYDGFTSD